MSALAMRSMPSSTPPNTTRMVATMKTARRGTTTCQSALNSVKLSPGAKNHFMMYPRLQPAMTA
jgi:hypothetical protein